MSLDTDCRVRRRGSEHRRSQEQDSQYARTSHLKPPRGSFVTLRACSLQDFAPQTKEAPCRASQYMLAYERGGYPKVTLIRCAVKNQHHRIHLRGEKVPDRCGHSFIS